MTIAGIHFIRGHTLVLFIPSRLSSPRRQLLGMVEAISNSVLSGHVLFCSIHYFQIIDFERLVVNSHASHINPSSSTRCETSFKPNKMNFIICHMIMMVSLISFMSKVRSLVFGLVPLMAFLAPIVHEKLS